MLLMIYQSALMSRGMNASWVQTGSYKNIIYAHFHTYLEYLASIYY